MTENRKDNIFMYALLFGIGFMLCVVLKQCTDVPVIPQNTHTIDTVWLDKPFKPVPIKPNNEPVKRKIYKQKDTTLRKEVEKKPIIIAVDIKPGEVDITTIDTVGKIQTDIHKIELDSPEIKIDNTGQVEEKHKTKAGKIIKKVWKGTKTGLAIIGGIVVVVFVGSHL